MRPAQKRFNKKFQPIADTLASADVDQEQRERLAVEMADALEQRKDPDFKRDLFVLLASDPLVPCAGLDDGPCPNERRIRVPMHSSEAPDGRSAMWQERPPTVWCVSCGFENRLMKGTQ